MMKQILNEWKKFILKEGPTRQDQELGAPAGWFSVWNDHMGVIDFLPEYQTLLAQFKTEYDNLARMAMDKNLPKEDMAAAAKAYSSMTSGFAYYSANPKIESLAIPMEDVVNTKLDFYFNDPNVPQEHKDFFSGNYERIMDYGKNTKMPNRLQRGTGPSYSGNTGFKGSVSDFYMFGDGIDQTRAIMDDYFSGKTRPDPTEPPEDLGIGKGSDEFEAAQKSKVDFYTRFFQDRGL